MTRRAWSEMTVALLATRAGTRHRHIGLQERPSFIAAQERASRKIYWLKHSQLEVPPA